MATRSRDDAEDLLERLDEFFSAEVGNHAVDRFLAQLRPLGDRFREDATGRED